MKRECVLCTVQIPTPDGGDLSLPVRVTVEREENPCDKPAEHYRGGDDGYIATDIEICD